MDSTTRKLRFIFDTGAAGPNDIIYALSLKGLSLAAVADACGVSRPMVSQVIHGGARSRDVATYISAQLGISMKKLWGDKYEYTPRRGNARGRLSAQHAANA